MTEPEQTYLFEVIGFVRSPFSERAFAPRQATLASEVKGCIELAPGRGYEHALEGLDGWGRVWIVFVFHKNVEEGRGFRPKVLPPRSDRRQGVFATRSPHRPNPIGLSAVEIDRVEGLSVYVRGLDLLDGTPVLDIKPYVPYADAHAGARSGWLEAADPAPPWPVAFDAVAEAQLGWLSEQGIPLRSDIERALALGPQPHAYRRIRRVRGQSGAFTLGLKEWRVEFVVEGRCVRVRALRTGYKERQLAEDPSLAVHRRFAALPWC